MTWRPLTNDSLAFYSLITACTEACETKKLACNTGILNWNVKCVDLIFIFQHNTQGINCEKCEVYFFRPVDKNQSDPDACKGKESINEMFVLQLLKVAKDFGHFFLLFAPTCDNVD